MKILALGNSFSQDATRYLHQIAKADETDFSDFDEPISEQEVKIVKEAVHDIIN